MRFGAKSMEEHGRKWFNTQKVPRVQPHLSEEILYESKHLIWREHKYQGEGTSEHFTARSFNAFLGTPLVEPEMYFMILKKPPYRDIHHTFCGEDSAARWARGENGTQLTLSFSYLTKEARV
ncbi:hypothetical protein HAX54_027358 [Datura stramonium]|uniref:Uncharacterized protein n=1 Tax=Datura stramonium TaxID=4076 RepID=A0ABS8V2N8_DATST|nr:hypothetical protein [Datura stramonium]